MSIRIDRDKCDGCGLCAKICPGNLIRMEGEGKNRKAVMAYPDECWGCMSCVKVCPHQAIEYYLGEDIGGKGGTLQAKVNRKEIEWTACQKGCLLEKIITSREASNKY